MPYDVPFAEDHISLTACDLPLSPASSNRSTPYSGRDPFAQLIHHGGPDLGLFSQAFLWDSTFWRPGAPIAVFLPEEAAIDNYGSFARPEFSTVGVIAENLGAAVIVLEHRYFGSSLPYRNFTRANLQYLTVKNALKDIVRFANHFVAPWTDDRSSANDVPWILIDRVVEAGDEESLQAIKTLFGLAEMKTPDFLYGLSLHWSEWSTTDVGRNSTNIETYCAWVEGSEHEQESEDMHWRLFRDLSRHIENPIEARADWATRSEQALRALLTYSAGFHNNLARTLCTEGTCLDETYMRLTEALGSDRMFEWLLCNDHMGGYTTGAPIGTVLTPLVSRFLTYDYFQRWCAIVHSPGPSDEPEHTASGHPSAEALNRYTGGWYPTNARRIIYSAGEMDVWREMSVSASLRPGGPLQSNPELDVVVHLLKTGWYHSEMYTRNVELNDEVRRIRDQEVDQICSWVQQWPKYR